MFSELTVEFRNGKLEIIYPPGFVHPKKIEKNKTWKKSNNKVKKHRTRHKKSRVDWLLHNIHLQDELKKFWDKHPLTQTERTNLLRVFSEVDVPKLKKHWYRVREEFEKVKWKVLPIRHSSVCFSCGGKPEIRHHIIMVRNGGDNRKDNLLWLCKPCHKDIHPWMDDK